jgi:hypothetical protein
MLSGPRLSGTAESVRRPRKHGTRRFVDRRDACPTVCWLTWVNRECFVETYGRRNGGVRRPAPSARWQGQETLPQRVHGTGAGADGSGEPSHINWELRCFQ